MSKIVGFQTGHDVSYCILEDGIPVIHEELERFNREKSPAGDGIEFFMNQNPDMTDIQYFVYGNPNGRGGRYSSWGVDNKDYESRMTDMVNKNDGKFYVIGHHQSHAANAFYTSDFSEALIVTIDGGGTEKRDENDWLRDRHYTGFGREGLSMQESFGTSFTAWQGNENKIKRLNIEGSDQSLCIGTAWNRATSKIFGLSTGHPNGDQAGTVMAMGTIGNPAKYVDMFRGRFTQGDNTNYTRLAQLANSSEQEAFDIAAGLQKATEEVFRTVLTPIIESYNGSNLCLSGGASLNCVMTTKIYDWFPKIKNIFCDPVPYDGGLSIGSARFVWHNILDNKRIHNSPKNASSYLGRVYTEKDILTAIESYKLERQK